MANTTSAKKATRKIARRTAVNKARRSRVRGFIRKVEEAIASGDQTGVMSAFLESTAPCRSPRMQSNPSPAGAEHPVLDRETRSPA